MEKMNTEYERTISLTDLLVVFKKCWILLAIVGIVVGALTFTYAIMTYQEQYTAESSLVVIRKGSGSGSGSYGTGDYSVDLYMVNDVARLLKTPSFLNMVVEDLAQNPEFTGHVTVKSLERDIKIETFDDTRFVCFTNTASTKKNAELIAQSLCRLVKEQIEVNFDVDRVSIVDDGFVGNSPSNSKITMLHMVVPVLAVFGVYVVFLLIHMFDDKIRTPEDVEKYLGLNLLGMIPNIDAAGKIKSRYYTAYYSRYGKYSEYGQSKQPKSE